jgi:hypothetical protein
MIATAFQFITLEQALVFFYVEGIGFTIALAYFYHIFVRGGRPFHLDLFNKFETPVIDRGYNEKIVEGAMGLGRTCSKVHTGNLNTYLIWVVFGFLIVLVWIALQLWLT